MTRKPWFRRGEPLPLLSLSSDEFENFVYLCVSELGSLLNLDVTQGPSESSDAGFDITARRRLDDALACIQCKRLASTFHLVTIGPELAKVALNSKLESSRILEHRLITAGSVSETLRSALRQSSRQTLIDAAIEATRSTKLRNLCSRARAAGLDVEGTVTAYVRDLQVITVWSNRNFSLELERVWDRIEPVIGRYFAVHIVLEEPSLGLIRFRRRQMKGGYDGSHGEWIEEAAGTA